LVDGGAEARVVRVFDDARTRTCAVPARQAPTAIVYDHHFQILPRLPQERFYTLPKPRIGSEGRDDHRYEEIGQT
jgi:hypothetical protein